MSYNSALLVFMFVINIIQHPVNAYRVFERDSGVTILALENETVNIQCQTNMPMAYCGFIHPSGVRYSFTGQGLKDGQCALKRKVSTNDSGEWKCHIGKESTGVELQQTILLRVVSHLAAIRPNLTAVHGKSVALECATTKRMTPLQYCRFEPPMGTPFSISPAITAESPILGRFYYPLNKSLDRGDCVMTIRKVKYEDVGLWTCGAGLDDGKEHIDIISLQVDGKAKFVPETEDIENKADCSPPLKRSNIESNKKSSILFDSEIAIATQSQVCSENDTTTKAKDQHYEADSDCTYFEQDSQSIEDYLALGNRPKYTEDEEVFAGSAKQDIATQTLNDANESVGVQTINFANNEYENIKDANYHFGMFVGRELNQVPPIKRRAIMWEIIRFVFFCIQLKYHEAYAFEKIPRCIIMFKKVKIVSLFLPTLSQIKIFKD